MWLTELSEDQRRVATQVIRDWLDAVVCTAPVDRPAAESAVVAACRAAGLDPPQMVWVESPLVGALATALLAVFADPDRFAGRSGMWQPCTGSPMCNDVWRELEEQVSEAARSELRSATGGTDVMLGDVAEAVNNIGGHPTLVQLNVELGDLGWLPAGPRTRLDATHRASDPATSPALRQRVLGAVGGLVGIQSWEQVADRLAERAFPEASKRNPGRDGSRVMTNRWDPVNKRMMYVEANAAERAQEIADADWSETRAAWATHKIRNISVYGWGSPVNSWGYAEVLFRLGFQPAGRLAAGWEAQRAVGAWWLVGEDVAILCERPWRLARDDQGRLHHPDGPALAYRDGFEVYAWHGVRVPRPIIAHPETLSVADIDGIEVGPASQRGDWAADNIEIRRVMLERFGYDRYLREAGAELIHQDRFGRLYRRDLDFDEPIVMVEVTNATPQPDGTRRRYLLRVPPDMRTARQAVAWTFGYDRPSHYNPRIET